MITTFRLPYLILDMLAQPLMKMAENVAPSQCLDNGKDIYLRRWYLERSRELGNVYLHQTMRSDYDKEHHDHPWDNLSICLHEEWIEEVTMPDGQITQFVRSPGMVISRPAATLHRIIIGSPSWTLFLTGPKAREWGFQHENGWMHNQDFFRLRGY